MDIWVRQRLEIFKNIFKLQAQLIQLVGILQIRKCWLLAVMMVGDFLLY